MKMISKAAIAAAAFAILVPATAFAQCTGASQEAPGGFVYNANYGVEGNYWSWPYSGVYGYSVNRGDWTGEGDCVTPYGNSYGHGVATTGNITVNADGEATYNPPTSFVYGPDSTAVGNGATVGRRGFWNDNGTPGDWSDDFWDVSEVNPVADGTAIGARANVQHDHSTAIGADAATDRENQIVLGTEDDEVTVRNLTKNTADKADTAGIVVHKADGTLASDGGRIQSEINHNAAVNHAQDNRLDRHRLDIDENTAAINHNTAAIEDNAASAAIALSMPDSFLNDSESYSIAAGFGGTGDDTAFGAIGTIRFDETWSGYVGGGLSFKGDQYGWKAGARAGW